VFAEIDAGDAYFRTLDSKIHHAQRKGFVLLDNINNQVGEECWTSETIMSTHMYNVNDLLSDILLPLVNKNLNNFPGKTSIILSDWKTATDTINVAPSFALYEFCTSTRLGIVFTHSYWAGNEHIVKFMLASLCSCITSHPSGVFGQVRLRTGNRWVHMPSGLVDIMFDLRFQRWWMIKDYWESLDAEQYLTTSQVNSSRNARGTGQ
jgi:hypothetical protein